MDYKFDMEKSFSEMVDYQKKLVKGVENLMNIPKESMTSDLLEKELVLTLDKVKLYHYKPLVAKTKVSKVPTMITYALVNRQYMMDIQPDRSVIKEFLSEGLDVYIVDWGYPSAMDRYNTMDDHINYYMNECVDYIKEKAKVEKINMLGVCQGGTFTAIYAAIYPEKVKNLVTMVTPVDFSSDDALLFTWSKHMDADALVDAYGTIPGSVMNFSYVLLKPLSLSLDKYVGLGQKIDDPEFLQNFMRMENWIFDSPNQAGETIRQFINDLYKANKLIKNQLVIGDKKVNLKNIDMPLLNVCAEFDHLVPFSSSEPLMNAVSSKDKEIISFKTGHIGMYVSAKSQKEIAPKIGEWLQERSK